MSWNKIYEPDLPVWLEKGMKEYQKLIGFVI